jgi:endonuclease/exonuclease/phosphatase family metal-dependent hydrolase
MSKSGFADSFREINPEFSDSSATIPAERMTYRIDYIYYKGKVLNANNSNIHFRYKGIWPSDHQAVTITILINN